MRCLSSARNSLINHLSIIMRPLMEPSHGLLSWLLSLVLLVHNSQMPMAGWTFTRGTSPIFVIVKGMGYGLNGSICGGESTVIRGRKVATDAANPRQNVIPPSALRNIDQYLLDLRGDSCGRVVMVLLLRFNRFDIYKSISMKRYLMKHPVVSSST